MELEIVVDDGVISVVELKEVFECSSSFFLLCLHIVNFDWADVNCCTRVAPKESRETERIRKCGES